LEFWNNQDRLLWDCLFCPTGPYYSGPARDTGC